MNCSSILHCDANTERDAIAQSDSDQTRTNKTPVGAPAPLNGGLFAYDLEVYQEFFLAVFQDQATGEFVTFTIDHLPALKAFINQPKLTLIGFNSYRYDDVLLKMILNGAIRTCQQAFDISKRIIEAGELKEWRSELWTVCYVEPTPWFTVDVQSIKPSTRIAACNSLKEHEVRLRMPVVQDLPFPPEAHLTDRQKQTITAYCRNDVAATSALFDDYDNMGIIGVRMAVEQAYPFLKGQSFYKNDAGIAESVMAELYRSKTGIKKSDIGKPGHFYFDPNTMISSEIAFVSAHNQAMLRQLKAHGRIEVSNAPDCRPINGEVALPQLKTLLKTADFQIGDMAITLGNGGLHTCIPAKAVKADLIDFDVASYYPNLLLKFARSPLGLTDDWIDILTNMTKTRLAAKAAGNKAASDTYKIIINSTYGKLKDQYSLSYDPALLSTVTINGQLFLLMLMERMHQYGIDIVSANTDGILVKPGENPNAAYEVAREWENSTGFKLEAKTATHYIGLSVNNYALFDGRKCIQKKGVFANTADKKPGVVYQAVLNHFVADIPVEETIRRETNIHEFTLSGSVTKRTAKGTVLVVRWREETVQRINRWYVGIDGAPIYKEVQRSSDGSITRMKVPDSEGAMVVNVLTSTEIPPDLDYGHYIRVASDLVDDINHQTG